MSKSAFFSIGAVGLILMGCASGNKAPDYVPDKVVARIDEKSSRPSWVSESKSVFNEGGHLIILGVVEVPGDSRVQASFKMSDANARGNLSQKIETSITKIVEASDSGLNMEDQQLQSLIQEVSQTTLRNVDIEDRYWEKVLRTSSTGEQTMVMKVFSKIKLSKTEFAKLSAENVGKSKLSNSKTRRNLRSLLESNLIAQLSED